MNVVQVDGKGLDGQIACDHDVVLAMSWAELSAMASMINEALMAVDDGEFYTRVGMLPEEATNLLRWFREMTPPFD